MTRLVALLAALAAALVFAPAALAVTYTVNDPGDAADTTTADALCDSDAGTAGDQCTLRAAIQQANFTPSADTITFTGPGTAPAPAAALPVVTDTLTVEGAGVVTVAFGGAAAGPLFEIAAPDSTLRSIALTGGASGPVVYAHGSGDHLDSVNVHDTPGDGMYVSGSSARVDAARLDKTGGAGIVAGGSSVTVASPVVTAAGGPGVLVSGSGAAVMSADISGGATDGLRITGSSASVSGGKVHGNAGNGAAISGQGDTVSKVVFYGNGGNPIYDAPGANGGIAPPQNLRIGPRRPDGSLPLSGTAGGTVELWSGDPASSSAPSFLDAFGAGGDFTYSFPSEPAPGSVFSANVSNGGSSEFARVVVPDDVVSPTVLASRALDTANVRIDASEPLDPASVQKEDFTLTMAGVQRTIDGVTVAPDGRSLTLTASGWKAGEAGYVDLGAPGSIADAAGNASLAPARLRVFAAPGDFVAPLGAKLAISPASICLTHGKGCRKTGMTIRFTTTEPGKATIVVKRGNVNIGKRLYGNIVAGPNALKFNGLLNARKLRAGRYRLLVYVQDVVGNVTDQPPIQLFSVRRVSK